MSVPAPHLSVLRRPEVEARVGLFRSSIYAFMAAGRIPKPTPRSNLYGRGVNHKFRAL